MWALSVVGASVVGAGDRLLLFTATAATIAGGLTTGGAEWAEGSAERDAQLLIAERERRDLALDPAGEVEELATHRVRTSAARGASREAPDGGRR